MGRVSSVGGGRVSSSAGILPLLLMGSLLPSAGVARQVAGQPAGGQEMTECDVPSHRGFTSTMLSNGDRVVYFSHPVFRCSGGTRITTDSARVYESSQNYSLWGHVTFQDAESNLTADTATYFGRQRRLEAWGNPVLTNQTDASVIRGDRMVLLRAGPGREEDELTVTGRRPHATLYPSRQEEGTSPEEPPDTGAGAPPRSPPDTAAVGVPLRLPPPEAARPPPPPSAEPTPYEIDASRIVLQGSHYFRATGSVVVERDSLTASADSVEYDQSGSTLSLSRDAHLETATYDLDAQNIVLVVPGDDVREVVARKDAMLLGEDLELLAPIISLFLEEGKLQRLVAVRDVEADSLAGVDSLAGAGSGRAVDPARIGAARTLLSAGAEAPAGADSAGQGPPRRPEALARDFSLTADSMEVLSPGEELDRVRAMGRARGESMGRDSLNTPDTPSLIQRDWLEGDTIVATFARPGDTLFTLEDSLAARGDSLEDRREPPPLERVQGGASRDSSDEEYQLRRLVAHGHARTLYRLAPADSTVTAEGGPPAAHYVVGDEVTILLTDGEVERMEVKGQTLGVHLEPAATGRSGGEAGGEPGGGSGAGPGRGGGGGDAGGPVVTVSRRDGARPRSAGGEGA